MKNTNEIFKFCLLGFDWLFKVHQKNKFMKKTILFGLLLLVSFLSHSQTTDQIPKYAIKYTTQKAHSLILLKDFEKAVWYLINIYGAEPKIAENKI